MRQSQIENIFSILSCSLVLQTWGPEKFEIPRRKKKTLPLFLTWGWGIKTGHKVVHWFESFNFSQLFKLSFKVYPWLLQPNSLVFDILNCQTPTLTQLNSTQLNSKQLKAISVEFRHSSYLEPTT